LGRGEVTLACGGGIGSEAAGGFGGCEQRGVEGDEEALGLGEDDAVVAEELGAVVELAALAAGVVADEAEILVEWGGAQVVDLHVAGHGDDVEEAVELAHGLVHEGGDDAAVDVAGWALEEAGEMHVRGGGVRLVVEGEVQVQAVGVWSENCALAPSFIALAAPMLRYRGGTPLLLFPRVNHFNPIRGLDGVAKSLSLWLRLKGDSRLVVAGCERTLGRSRLDVLHRIR
jgi:hypothetical protein